MRSSALLHAGRSGAGIRFALAAVLALGLGVGFGCARAPRSAPAPDHEPTVEYRVKHGDTPEIIAAWHGVDAEAVRRLNGIDRDEALAPGSVLRVPERPLATHALRSGDTLGQVGQWYGADIEALIHLNDVADVRKLPIGQVIRIPATATRDGSRAVARPRGASEPRVVAARPAVASGPPAASQAPAEPVAPARAEVDRTLVQASDAFDAADFDGALAAAQGAERLLPAAPLAPDDRRRLARAHLLAGMSNVALGRDEAARSSFRAAVALDDAIAPDPARTSPKILTVFNEAQAP